MLSDQPIKMPSTAPLPLNLRLADEIDENDEELRINQDILSLITRELFSRIKYGFTSGIALAIIFGALLYG